MGNLPTLPFVFDACCIAPAWHTLMPLYGVCAGANLAPAVYVQLIT